MYSTGYLVDMGDDITVLKREKVQYRKSTASDFLYTLKDGDRLWDLAYQFYGDSKKWFIIADVNPIIENPLELTPGTKIIIPDLELVTLQAS